MSVDPLVEQITSQLRERKESLEGERREAQEVLQGIEDQLASVNAAWTRLTGDSPKPAATAPAPRSEPTKRTEPNTNQASAAKSTKKRSDARRAVIKGLRDHLPQDGDWHSLGDLLATLAPLASDGTIQSVLKEQPIERQSGGHGNPWKVRWKADAPKVTPVTEVERREYILAHKDGFTLKEMAEFFGRSTSWVAKDALPPFLNKGMLRVEKGIHHNTFPARPTPDRYIYVQPQSQTAPKATSANSSNGGTKRSEPVPGTGKSRDLPQQPELRRLLLDARRQGFRVGRNGSDHFMVVNPKTGQTASVSGTPRTGSTEKVKKDLRGIGVRV